MQGAVMGFYFRNAEFDVYVCPDDPLGALNRAIDECLDTWLERIGDERDPDFLILGQFDLEPDHVSSFGPILKGDIKRVSPLALGQTADSSSYCRFEYFGRFKYSEVEVEWR
jgi:hypothetical protein